MIEGEKNPAMHKMNYRKHTDTHEVGEIIPICH